MINLLRATACLVLASIAHSTDSDMAAFVALAGAWIFFFAYALEGS